MSRVVRRWILHDRDNRRLTRPSRSRQRRRLDLALIVLFPVGCVLGWLSLTHYAEHHPYFTVQEIIVEDSGGFPQEDVLEWSGVNVGMSMWTVDPEQIEEHLLSHSWIQSAQVRRDFPQRVHIAISIRRPVAIVLHDSERDRLPQPRIGQTFVRPEASPIVDLPYISGFAGLPLDAPAIRSALDGVLRLLSLSHLWQEPVSEISWDAQQGYSLFLDKRRITVRLGWETTPEKFTQIGKVLAKWSVDAPAAMLDARFADQIIVRPYAIENSARRRALSRPL